MNSDLTQIKHEYLETIQKIVPVLPTLLALIDFQKTGNFELIAERKKKGEYGTIDKGMFLAPKTGPYVNFLNDIGEDQIKKMQELFFAHEL